MSSANMFGPATRENALFRLSGFLPHMGARYAQQRNSDPGPDARATVSKLSPFVRRRLVLEQELVGAAIKEHGPEGASKFISEVVWRTYFKGWLECRPSVWTDYLSSLEVEREKVINNKYLLPSYQKAIEGKTGLCAFDSWVHELRDYGYLHNHARMWFASIWIFTLRLPWELGAEFFLQHLLDGDAASNTCSWRWVGGRHTLGKTYLARSSNIARFTNERFDLDPAQLADDAPAPEDAVLPDLKPVRQFLEPQAGLKTGLLVTQDDCFPESLDFSFDVSASVATADKTRQRLRLFEAEALSDTRKRNAGMAELADPDQIGEWVDRYELQQVVLPFQPIGPAKDALAPHLKALEGKDVRVAEVMREWDAAFWPHATAGFFKVKKRIPAVLDDLL